MPTPEPFSISSPAKINWLLNVGPLRPDNYHHLQTIYQTISLADALTFEALPATDACILAGFPPDIDPATNLVKKAWNLCRTRWPERVRGVRISVDKKLPRGGGLGGGSSNAGLTLRALSRLFDCGTLQDETHINDLETLAAQIGSDVPFFITGGTATGTGRGEVIQSLSASAPLWLVLITPDESINTGEAYRHLDRIQRPFPSERQFEMQALTLSEALRTGNAPAVASLITNDFELVAERHSWYRNAKAALEDAGALRAFLCGSGSSIAGLFPNEAAAQRAAGDTGGILTHTTPPFLP